VLDSLPVSGWELSGWGIVALVVVLLLRHVASIQKAILTGELVTRREVDAEKDRANTWQAAWAASQMAHREKDEALGELLESSRIIVRVLDQMQNAAEATRHEAGDLS
jgi:hypothetical protein